MVIALVVVVAVFTPSLYRLARFALGSEFYSYIVLIPFISGYLAWRVWPTLPVGGVRDVRLAASLLAGGGLLLAVAPFLLAVGIGWAPAPADSLALSTTSFLLVATGAIAWFLGWSRLRALRFPIGFMAFMIPLPVAVMTTVETFLQHGSAAVAHALFRVVGTAVFYQDLNFQLPGMNLHVAPECSGIRSTMVLLIVAVLTGHVFLRSPVRCALLAALIVPLALLRNGLRIFTVGELCVHYGPQMIDSYLHRHGGPLFFAASLVPFFGLVFLLRQREPPPPPLHHRPDSRQRPAPVPPNP